jgi:opacity protein-like surface antigen
VIIDSLVFKEFLMRRTFMLSALLALAIPAAALAQDKPVEVNFGGGFTFPVGDVADSFDTGWNFAGGLTFNVNETVGFQGEYQFHRFGGPDRTFDDPISPGNRILIESNHQLNVVDFNVVLRGGSGPVKGYLVAGPGIYWRKVQLTTPSVGFITVCDPYWYVCYPAAVPVDQVVGDRTSTDFGVNVGGGVSFGAFYVEARYHYVWGPEIKPQLGAQAGQTFSSNATYFPVTFGFRF